MSIYEVFFNLGYFAPVGALLIIIKLINIPIPEEKKKKPISFQPGM